MHVQCKDLLPFSLPRMHVPSCSFLDAALLYTALSQRVGGAVLAGEGVGLEERVRAMDSAVLQVGV